MPALVAGDKIAFDGCVGIAKPVRPGKHGRDVEYKTFVTATNQHNQCIGGYLSMVPESYSSLAPRLREIYDRCVALQGKVRA